MTLKRALTLLSFVLPFGVLIFTVAPGIYWEDSAAFQAAAFELGIVHNPSFPSYVLAAHVFSLLPFATPQWWVNVASAAGIALSALFLFLCILRIPRYEGDASERWYVWSALAASLSFAFIYGVWTQGVRAEVYAFNSVLITALIWNVLRLVDGEVTPRKFALIAGFITGLGLTSHYLIFCAVAFPVLLAVLIHQRSKLLNPRSVGTFILPAVLCLSLYVYLPIRESADPYFNWGDFSSISATLHSILRVDEVLPIEQLTVATPFVSRLGSTLSAVVGSLPLALWFFAAIGVYWLFKSSRIKATVVAVVILSSVFVTAYAADFSPYNLDLYGYLMPAYAGIILALGAGVVFGVGIALKHSRLVQPKLRYGLAMGFIAVLFIKAGFLVATNYTDASKRNLCVADEYATGILESLGPKAIFLAGEDNSFSPLLCKQAVEGYRTDVAVLSAGALLRTDYRRKMHARHDCFWYPDNWDDPSFSQDFQNNLSNWVIENSKDYQVAMTLSQWTSQLAPHLTPNGFFYTYSDSTSMSQESAAQSVKFYREHENLWCDSHDIITREHFGRLLYNLAVFYSKHHQMQLAAKYNRDAADADPTNLGLLLGCFKMAFLAKQPADQERFASAIEELDPGNQKLAQLIQASAAAMKEQDHAI